MGGDSNMREGWGRGGRGWGLRVYVK